MSIQGSVFQYITFSVLLLSFCVQLFFWLRYYLRSAGQSSKPVDNEKPPVSVIICARNESVNLKENLPPVLQQDYPEFEVIVVNDCSEDESEMVLSELKLRYPHLKISTIKKDPLFHHNKKLAQIIGIKAAANDILLFTDADCAPVSDKWIELMTAHIRNEKNIVLGYGGYKQGKGLLNQYIRYDSMFIAMQYIGRALRGKPYMGVGRNLSYRKSLFFANNGFSTHYHIPSGDDDLFVNANAGSVNTGAETGMGSHTRSVPVTSFSELLRQKQRHMSTAGMYRTRDKFMLIAEPGSRVLFYSSFVLLLVVKYMWPAVLGLFVVRATTMIIVLYKAGRRFDDRNLTFPALFFDLLAPFINSLFYLSALGNKGKKKPWR